ncbi:hypothetical protein [Spirosoma pomorum]
MKTLQLFWFSFGCWLLIASQTKSPTYGRITIHAPSANGQSVKLTTPNLFTLSPTSLADATFDATGTATLQVPLTGPLFTDVEIGQKRYGLLISPGDDLAITLPDQPTSPVRFAGKGAQAANYLTGMTAIWQQY